MPSVLSTLATFSVSSSSFSSGRSGKARRNVTLNCYNIKSQKSWKEDFSNLPQGPFCRLGILRWGRCSNPRQSGESMFIISRLILKMIIFSDLLCSPLWRRSWCSWRCRQSPWTSVSVWPLCCPWWGSARYFNCSALNYSSQRWSRRELRIIIFGRSF